MRSGAMPSMMPGAQQVLQQNAFVGTQISETRYQRVCDGICAVTPRNIRQACQGWLGFATGRRTRLGNLCRNAFRERMFKESSGECIRESSLPGGFMLPARLAPSTKVHLELWRMVFDHGLPGKKQVRFTTPAGGSGCICGPTLARSRGGFQKGALSWCLMDLGLRLQRPELRALRRRLPASAAGGL